MMLPAPNTQGKGGGGFHSACALPSPSTGAGEDQPSPAACTRPPTAFSSEAAGDDSRREKGRKESAGDVQEEMAEGTPTFTQRQERGVTSKATVHVVVAAAGGRVRESLLRAGLQEFGGCLGLEELCSQPGRSWGGGEGC